MRQKTKLICLTELVSKDAGIPVTTFNDTESPIKPGIKEMI